MERATSSSLTINMKIDAPCSEISEAVKFYLRIITTPEERKKIRKVDVTFDKFIEEQGHLHFSDLDPDGNPRKFHIVIGKNLEVPMLQVVAHECVHIKQAIRNELEYLSVDDKIMKNFWKGEAWEPTKYQCPHFDSPWEIEANGWEQSLYLRFINRN